MSGGIFVSYRRDDAKHAAGRLVDRLEKSFSRDQLFFDVDNIAPGVDFVRVLKEQVQACDVLLAVIGPGWIESRDASGARRLDNPKDFVRIELEAALARDIRVIPVLVDGAQMPGETELPPPLQPLATRNAVRLAHERFAADAEGLTKALEKVVAPAKRGWFGGQTSKPAAAPMGGITQSFQRPLTPHQDGVTASRSRIPTVIAGLFAIAAFPVTLASGNLFQGIGWNWLGDTKDGMYSGIFAGAVLVLISALVPTITDD